MSRALDPNKDAAWIITEYGCDPLRETNRETRFAISNGFLGVRSAQAVNGVGQGIALPYTYVAGLFDSAGVPPAIPGLVRAPDWLGVRLSVTGGSLVPQASDGDSSPLTLDMERGIVLTESRQFHETGVSVALRMLSLVSRRQPALGLQLLELSVEDGDLDVTLQTVPDAGPLRLTPAPDDRNLGVWRAGRSHRSLAMAAAASLAVDGHDLAPTEVGDFRWSWTWRASPGQVVLFQRVVAFTRCDDPGIDPGPGARAALDGAVRLGWSGIVSEHEAAWGSRWASCDIVVDGDPASQRALRFAAYHLNSAANPMDDRVSIGARALTGADYLGHVFWDTEIFLLPFYVFTWPEAARSLLMYRFHTLDAARAKATGMGWRGALYAWESADAGAEVTPEQVVGPDRRVIDVLCGRQEQHISADVAYAVWHYWQATADEVFLLGAGAEILLETGRFWSSRAQLEADGRRHIRGVIGPDEYHEDIDDNAFTNVMARWNINRALEIAAMLRERWPLQWVRLSAELGLDDAELKQWSIAAETIVTGLDPKTGLLEQFSGFFGLEKIDLADYAGRSAPMDMVLGPERTRLSQVVKQADVVALLALLPKEFPADSGAANFRYYEPKCGHGSSLSRAMHGLAAARLGETEIALGFFRQTAAIDLADTHVAIGGGIHIAALGGLWQIAVFGFAGLSLCADGVAFDPRLPAGWLSLGFSVRWRGRALKIRIEQSAARLEATLLVGEAMMLFVCGERHELSRDRPLRAAINGPARGTDPGGVGAPRQAA